jgi:hypothetical protein
LYSIRSLWKCSLLLLGYWYFVDATNHVRYTSHKQSAQARCAVDKHTPLNVEDTATGSSLK